MARMATRSSSNTDVSPRFCAHLVWLKKFTPLRNKSVLRLALHHSMHSRSLMIEISQRALAMLALGSVGHTSCQNIPSTSCLTATHGRSIFPGPLRPRAISQHVGARGANGGVGWGKSDVFQREASTRNARVCFWFLVCYTKAHTANVVWLRISA